MNIKQYDKANKAVAIKYNPKDGAPVVTAKGQGFVAKQIFEKAQEENVPIYHDKKLVDELSKIELGIQIPEELYEAVAQVLIFISDLDKLEEYKRLG